MSSLAERAAQETYERLLALADQRFPARVTLTLEQAAQFLTEDLGMPTSPEMCRVYAKSGRLIPGLRKSPADTWLMPKPALVAGIVEGLLLVDPDEVPQSVMRSRAPTPVLAAAITTGLPVPRRRGRRPSSARTTFGVDGFLFEADNTGRVVNAWRWSTDWLEPPAHPAPSGGESRPLAKRALERRQRAKAAWEALAEAIEAYIAKKRADERAADLATMSSHVTTKSTGRQHS